MSLPRLHLDELREANVSLVQSRTIVAVFTGGTGGIGEYTINAPLATHCQQNDATARIYTVGRNKAAAQATSKQYSANANLQFHFIQASDLSLLKDVDKCCDEIKRIEPAHIDILVMTHADLCFRGRRETTEGLEKSLSLFYYSRIRFAFQVMPLLERSELPNAARVVSVYAAGFGNIDNQFHKDDITLLDAKHYSYPTMQSHATILKTLVFEILAHEHPFVSFVHVFPSLVLTEGYKTNLSPEWLRAVWMVMKPLIGPLFAVPSDESGQRTLGLASHGRFGRNTGEGVALATDGQDGGGAYSCKYDGQTNKLKGYGEMRKTGFSQAAWQHTMDVFDAIEVKGRFKCQSKPQCFTVNSQPRNK